MDLPSSVSSCPIGNDILDIGSRKSIEQARLRNNKDKIQEWGIPGQFDLPNVPDVSVVIVILQV